MQVNMPYMDPVEMEIHLPTMIFYGVYQFSGE